MTTVKRDDMHDITFLKWMNILLSWVFHLFPPASESNRLCKHGNMSIEMHITLTTFNSLDLRLDSMEIVMFVIIMAHMCMCACVCACDIVLVKMISQEHKLGLMQCFVCICTMLRTKTILSLVRVKGHLRSKCQILYTQYLKNASLD